ncbi:MAG: hypothetical protein R3Y63_13280 [Eubacteriales bacterium]
MGLQLQNMEEDDFSDVNYFEDLKESLEEVLAFERGESNTCRVHNREIP